MTSSRLLSLLSVFLLHMSFQVSQADNLYIVAKEVGNDVVISFKGSIDTSEFDCPVNVTTTHSSLVNTRDGICSFVKPGTSLIEYEEIFSLPLIFGPRGAFYPTRSSGDTFIINQTSLYLSSDYISGSPLRGEMVFVGKTLRSIGFNPAHAYYDTTTRYGHKNTVRIDFLDRARADILINDNPNGVSGSGVFDPVTAPPAQTIKHSRKIFKSNTAIAHIRLANAGRIPGKFNFRTYGDRYPGMRAIIKQRSKNVTAAVRTGRFTREIPGNSFIKLIYRLKTDRFHAGVFRGGDRNDLVRFRLRGAGTVDNAAMLIEYSRSTK